MTPQVFRGIGVSPGIAIGRALVIEARRPRAKREALDPIHVPAEVARLTKALEDTRRQIVEVQGANRQGGRRPVRPDLRRAPLDPGGPPSRRGDHQVHPVAAGERGVRRPGGSGAGAAGLLAGRRRLPARAAQRRGRRGRPNPAQPAGPAPHHPRGAAGGDDPLRPRTDPLGHGDAPAGRGPGGGHRDGRPHLAQRHHGAVAGNPGRGGHREHLRPRPRTRTR